MSWRKPLHSWFFLQLRQTLRLLRSTYLAVGWLQTPHFGLQSQRHEKSMMPFNPKHEAQYGLKVASRDPASGAVMSSVCRFCSVFGREAREEKDGEPKRKRTTRTQHFITFRTDLYDKHMLSAHPGKSESYQRLLTDTDREAFFGVTVPFQDTIHAHFESGSPVLCMMISKSVLEDVIGGLLFHPDDAEGMSKQRALAAFEKMDRGDYRVQIKTAKRFTLLVKMVALSTSFRMAARIVQVVRDETGMSVYTGCSDTLASGYCRVIYAAALQKLSSLLIQVTGFSLALDALTLHSSSYLDVRVRFVFDSCTMESCRTFISSLYLYLSRPQARVCVRYLSGYYLLCALGGGIL
ncbi:hypothetical protein PF011_g6173 [Phytophthora fragariae]|uniref:Uncharacterized protein n=1 Tax=Phytophthora fragariae TaxID=53985 RepID=A0A6A3LR04_9STRA|nr:hypothetical protein PF011_g6173 [Phytophthora fragariae]